MPTNRVPSSLDLSVISNLLFVHLDDPAMWNGDHVALLKDIETVNANPNKSAIVMMMVDQCTQRRFITQKMVADYVYSCSTRAKKADETKKDPWSGGSWWMNGVPAFFVVVGLVSLVGSVRK
jgi:hypothetical protein